MRSQPVNGKDAKNEVETLKSKAEERKKRYVPAQRTTHGKACWKVLTSLSGEMNQARKTDFMALIKQ